MSEQFSNPIKKQNNTTLSEQFSNPIENQKVPLCQNSPAPFPSSQLLF
jgi:hypothetical protein